MTRCRARNWSKSNQALVNQGSIIFWVQDRADCSWYSDQQGARGRPAIYSNQAILALMIVKSVYGCAFRQLQGLMRDVLKMMDSGCVCPDYTTICRRARGVSVPSNLPRKGSLNLVFDSTGLKVFGEGEWQARKHGYSKRRGWKKLHIVMCAETQQVVAASISDKDLHDSQALPGLLDAVKGDIAEVIGDGAYDSKACYEAIHRRGAKPIIPPRKGARKSDGSNPALHARDAAIHRIRDQKRGKRRWKEEVGYHRRSLVETAMHRYKALLGHGIQARITENQVIEISVKLFVLNEMMALQS
jgi:Transposase DDE domain